MLTLACLLLTLPGSPHAAANQNLLWPAREHGTRSRPEQALRDDGQAHAAGDSVVIEEWVVPWASTRPRDPFVGSDGLVWFVGQQGDYAANLDPETGAFVRFDLPDGSGPHNLIVDWLGTVWYTANRQAYIGALDPQDGSIRQISMPDAAARDPHTMAFGQNADIWFTVQGGNFIGRLDVETSEVTLVKSRTSNSNPYGIVVNSKGEPWVALFGTNKLARVDPMTMEVTEVVLPRSGARPRRLEVTSDDRVWYVDYSGGYLGVYDPVTGSIDEWRMPSAGSARPYGMAVDAADRLWFVETGPHPNRFIGFDPATETFLPATPIPSGGGTVRHMYFDPEENVVWFGTDANTIGRARLPLVAVAAVRDRVTPDFVLSSPYPNPASDRVRFVVTSSDPAFLMFTVVDVSGKVVMRSAERATTGTRAVGLDVSTLVPGMYVVRVVHGDLTVTRRMVVMNR